MIETVATQQDALAETLTRLASRRDAEAWADLLELQGAQILRIARAVLRDEALAEDACQETLLQVRDRVRRFKATGPDPEASARKWITLIAYHTALKLRRGRRSAKRREDMRRREFAMKTSDRAAEDRASAREELQAVNRELDRMPDRERLPILLRYHCELSFEELASTLQCPVGTAKARVHRGLERLRNRLAVLGIFIPLPQIVSVIHEEHACATGARLAPDERLVENWKSLLHSPRKPAPFRARHGGDMSTMTKIGIGIAACVFAAVIGLRYGTSNGTTHAAETHRIVRTKGGGPAIRETARIPAPETPSDWTVGDKPVAKAGKADVQAVVRGNNAFATDLYAKLKSKDGNLFFSPYSISTALAMTYAGARGQTAKQMADVLQFSLNEKQLHPAFASLLADQNKVPAGKKRGYRLHVANSLWGQQGYGFLKGFLTLTRSHYGAGLTEVDFIRNTEGARKTINAWVEKKTEDRIKELIKRGVMSVDNRLVLTNAIYFKGDWASQFKKESTAKAPFSLASGRKVQVPMMNQTEDFGYADEAGYQVLELPYAGKELAMVVFLPKTAGGLPSFETGLTPKRISASLKKLREREVVVALPKFKMTSEFRLDESLKAMGMTDAFRFPSADFSGMNGRKNLFIGAVVHKAFVDVNEEGTEAAAATAVMMLDGAPSRPSLTFRADRPFVFLIRDKRCGSVLFMGRVADPR